jgi:hypothetical protein
MIRKMIPRNDLVVAGKNIQAYKINAIIIRAVSIKYPRKYMSPLELKILIVDLAPAKY